jgi:hypothetical protein
MHSSPLLTCPPLPLPRSTRPIHLCAVGFISRPVGALMFGHMGDTRGRGLCLLVSVVLMGVPTVSGDSALEGPGWYWGARQLRT